METPQQEFGTPTEESKATQGRESPERAVEETLEIQSVVKESVDLPESPRTTAEPPEEAKQIVDDQKPPPSPIAEHQENINSIELSKLAEGEEGQVSYFGNVEKPLWLQEPTNIIEQLPEQAKHEELGTSDSATYLQEAEKNLITETPVEIPPEEELKEEATVTERIQELASEEHNGG